MRFATRRQSNAKRGELSYGVIRSWKTKAGEAEGKAGQTSWSQRPVRLGSRSQRWIEQLDRHSRLAVCLRVNVTGAAADGRTVCTTRVIWPKPSGKARSSNAGPPGRGAGLTDEARPWVSFLFLGPTGVG